MTLELKDTIKFMNSEDYRERFVAEYWQTKIRYEKLKKFNQRISVGQMSGLARFEPKHDCPLDILQDQQHLMGLVLDNLEKRAIIENIDLDMIFKPHLDVMPSKEKITLKEFFDSKEPLYIHCNTKDKAIKLLKEFDRLGKTWKSGRSYLEYNRWYVCRENTIYSNERVFADPIYGKLKNPKIYEFEDVIF